MDINRNDPEESSDEEEETISDEESEETISDEEVEENISNEEGLRIAPHLIPLRVHALADPDDNVYGEYLQLFPDSFLTVNNELVEFNNIDHSFILEITQRIPLLDK